VTAPRVASVVLDVDSTLCDLEGIDWLARLRGEEMARRCAQLTDRAMAGEIALETVYGERLDLIRPTRDEVDALGREYARVIAPGASDVLRDLRSAGVRVHLISGGFRRAIAPSAGIVGVSDAHLHAVDVRWDDAGHYVDFDRSSPLATQDGKPRVVERLALARPILAVGDGATDAAMRPAVDSFVAFTAFQRREAVVRAADAEVRGFAELRGIVLGSS
jgi:phosphoserine phosphatase